MQARLFMAVIFVCGGCFGATRQLELKGLPLQIDWRDVNGDGLADLIALMIETQTQGDFDTFVEDGVLKAYYEDQTLKEKYLATFINKGDHFEEAERLNYGQDTVLGFAYQAPGQLMVWRQGGLFQHRWSENRWDPFRKISPPGLLAQSAVQMSGFPFWLQHEDRGLWCVPDIDGLHLVDPTGETHFLKYPDFAYTRNSYTEKTHQLLIAMPTPMNVDQDPTPELVFKGNDLAYAYPWHETSPKHVGDAAGSLVDMDGDGSLELVILDDESDVDKMRDLPNVTSRMRIFKAQSPLKFADDPYIEQRVPGFPGVSDSDLDNDGDSFEFDIGLPQPFYDLNNDGKLDYAGLSMKMSGFQIVKLLSLGRLTIKFLLNLCVQEDGRFRTLQGGPFEMKWTLNIRKLKLPDFAQITGDYNGDGWLDILTINGNKAVIIPLGDSGFQHAREWKVKIPIKEPNQFYGKDLNNDGTSELVVLKLGGNRTQIGVVEARP